MTNQELKNNLEKLEEKYKIVKNRLEKVDDEKYNIFKEMDAISTESIKLMEKGKKLIGWYCEKCSNEPTSNSSKYEEYEAIQEP